MSKINSSLYYMKAAAAGGLTGPAEETRWAPNTDVYVTDEGLVIKVEVAGLRREDLEITVEGNRVMINGSRPDSCRVAKCRFLMMEINYGHFESVIDLPAGYDVAKARAAYQNGFLRMDIPPLTETSRTIPVLTPDGA
jgi:HSP20 family protein